MNTPIDFRPAALAAQLKSELLTQAARRRRHPEPETDPELPSPTEHRGEVYSRHGGDAPAWSALHD
jgi:hypothetical protein